MFVGQSSWHTELAVGKEWKVMQVWQSISELHVKQVSGQGSQSSVTLSLYWSTAHSGRHPDPTRSNPAMQLRQLPKSTEQSSPKSLIYFIKGDFLQIGDATLSFTLQIWHFKGSTAENTPWAGWPIANPSVKLGQLNISVVGSKQASLSLLLYIPGKHTSQI